MGDAKETLRETEMDAGCKPRAATPVRVGVLDCLAFKNVMMQSNQLKEALAKQNVEGALKEPCQAGAHVHHEAVSAPSMEVRKHGSRHCFVALASLFLPPPPPPPLPQTKESGRGRWWVVGFKEEGWGWAGRAG